MPRSFYKAPGSNNRNRDLLFEQVADENKEPYFIVHFENEKWYPTPVRLLKKGKR
jgi:hypothetical protein